jgi:hypothetical protein
MVTTVVFKDLSLFGRFSAPPRPKTAASCSRIPRGCKLGLDTADLKDAKALLDKPAT